MEEKEYQNMKYELLPEIVCPDDIKSLGSTDLYKLADEIRGFLVENVSKTGGHLASNLGIVELTISLHMVYDSPKDKFIFDVGHQAYVHKILTGRCDKFCTLRTLNGISGFPKRSESEHDILNTGHSSTSISAALGICRARDLKNEDFEVIAIIGDGSMTGGMAFEALNDAASSKSNITIIINDNGMSISKNVGAFSNYFTRLRTRKTYRYAKNKYENIFSRIPLIGSFVIKITEKIKSLIKYLFFDDVIFEQMGFVYMGTFDGHDIKKLTNVLKDAKEIKKPKIIHIATQKGKGYSFAEKKPDRFHGIGPFYIETGTLSTNSHEMYTDTAAGKLYDLMQTDKRIVIITAAMIEGLKLGSIVSSFPQRVFDVGIAEQHAVTMAAGLSIEKMIPVVTIYSTFLQRAYDQILHDVVLNSLPVVFLIDRGGLVGEDGETHHGIYDIAYLSSMPNINILVPASKQELGMMIEYAVNNGLPTAVRYPREGVYSYPDTAPVIPGKAQIIREGTDVSLIVAGTLLKNALKAADILANEGIDAEVINIRFIKPVDKETVTASALKTKKVVTIEDGVITGGFGSIINNILKNENVRIINMGVKNNNVITHATREQLLCIAGLDTQDMVNNVKFLFQDIK